ncbi:MAG: heterodisulfide reductase-related iron-sulfur binding cluster [Desulfovibrionales bacterium]
MHDPCPLRREDAIHSSVRTLLAAQGLTVRKTSHSGKHTLCCGEGGGVGFHNPGFAEAWAEKRKHLAGDDRIVTYCAGCAGFLGRVAPVSHLGEILFEPQKALAGKSKVARAPMTYVNRLMLKHRLKKFFSSPQGHPRDADAGSWKGPPHSPEGTGSIPRAGQGPGDETEQRGVPGDRAEDDFQGDHGHTAR